MDKQMGLSTILPLKYDSQPYDLILVIYLPVFRTAGELHSGECALWDGGNKENCSTQPDSCHAGDGNQPPQQIS